jgi:hypothetical protein
LGSSFGGPRPKPTTSTVLLRFGMKGPALDDSKLVGGLYGIGEIFQNYDISARIV